MSRQTFTLICLFVAALELTVSPLGLIGAYFVLSRYTKKLVIEPLVEKLSANKNVPTNYLYKKIQNIRLTAWVLAFVFHIQLVCIAELLIVGVASLNEYAKNEKDNAVKESNSSYAYNANLEKKMSMFNAELLLEQMPKRKTEDRPKVLTKPEVVRKEIVTNKQVVESKPIIKEEIKEVKEEIFYKPLDEIKTDFHIVSSDIVDKNKFDFNKPVDADSLWNSNDAQKAEEPAEMNPDDICCEKCGTIMSKHKVACPKCGTLVKNKYR